MFWGKTGLSLLRMVLKRYQILVVINTYQDGARPFTSNEIIKNCIKGLDKFDVVFPAIKIQDTLYVKEK